MKSAKEKLGKKEAKEKAEALIKQMTLQEKVGQVNQHLYGFNVYQKKVIDGKIVISLTDEFKKEVETLQGIGVLYGLYRADPWSKKDYETGLTEEEAFFIYNEVQRYLIENTRLQIPMLLSSECPHGHQALDGYLLPVNLAMGATFHPELTAKAYRVCGLQMKKLGVDFALISLLDILRDPRWGRSEECFSEDPYLASEMAKAVVTAVQGEGVDVVAKHLCAQGETCGGVNASAAIIGERELYEIHLPAVRACCEVGVEGVMAAYNEIDGIPCHSNHHLLTEILRNEMGFEGIVMADGTAIDRLDMMTGDNIESAAMALEAGIDVSLWDTAFTRLKEVIERYPELEKRLDEAVTRVLAKKYERGLMSQPYRESFESDKYSYDLYEESLDMARESIILLENKNRALPLDLSQIKKIAVIGPNADALYHQLGDYTPYVKEEEGVTILQGIESSVQNYNRHHFGGEQVEVTYAQGSPLLGEVNEDELERAIRIASASDVIVLVLGGSSSRFGKVEFDINGAVIHSPSDEMDCGEGVDVAQLELAKGQLKLIEEVLKLNKKTIGILIQGRPYCVDDFAKRVDGLFVAFYPGPRGGQAMSEILFGEISPSGCLPVSIPKKSGQLPVYYNHKASYIGMEYRDCNGGASYTFGYGLNYGEVIYHQVQIQRLKERQYKVAVTLENSSDVDCSVVVQLYIRKLRAREMQRIKELRAFKKVRVNKRTQQVVELTFDVSEDTLHECYLQDGNGLQWKDNIDFERSIL